RCSRDSQLCEFCFNDVIHLMSAELVCYADSVLDCVCVRTPVANDRNSLDAQEGSTAVFGVIETMLELPEGILREDGADFRRERLLQFLLEHGCERFVYSFAQFQCDIAGKTVTDDDIHITCENIASFDVLDEIDRRAFE